MSGRVVRPTHYLEVEALENHLQSHIEPNTVAKFWLGFNKTESQMIQFEDAPNYWQWSNGITNTSNCLINFKLYGYSVECELPYDVNVICEQYDEKEKRNEYD